MHDIKKTYKTPKSCRLHMPWKKLGDTMLMFERVRKLKSCFWQAFV